ncbi:uncharacterized protein LOC119079473 isoform X1 [Bradysia coprophila]|uniref:uncharacterized protein LOC119079473 isoform X1 n=2 Tax=Bradysia coprophila TaxID=38358 RepID=UPI00187D6F92|nr:uncharacterized protein LOC119079473 isoform X1 [Bradysia coprophila]
MRKLAVNTGMSRPPKPISQAKRVAPPAVPDVYRHSGSSFGSAGYGSSEDAGGFLTVPDATSIIGIRDDHSDYGSTFSKSPGVLSNYVAPNAFTFPTAREPLTHKAAVYYHQQLALQEDQGIDLTQSPGRDSPGSSSGSAGSGSRHSTASLDSGRASSYHTQTSSSTRGALSSPRCSVSSCSIGSVDRMTSRTDHEIITDWLRELNYEDYAQLFSDAGYDMPTISRMTPEDLTAIGIKKPHHREKIKQHIDALQLPDNLPNNVPGSIEEWLRLLRLEEYVQPLFAQGYATVRDVTQLPWEDMEDIGIVKLGHQKKLLLAIKRVKDIMSGKWVLPGLTPMLCGSQSSTHGSMQSQPHASAWSCPSTLPLQSPYTSHSADDYQLYQNACYEQQLYQQHAQQMVQWEQQNMMSQSPYNANEMENDIVLIKLRQPRGKSLESLEDPAERVNSGHLTFIRPTEAPYFCHQGVNILPNMMHQQYPQTIQQMPWRRSYDDGDITPTNEIALSSCDQQGGTLPRHHRSNVPRQQRSTGINSFGGLTSQQQQAMLAGDYTNENAMMCPTKCYGSHCATRSPGMLMSNRKQPPEPPRRQCSVVDQATSHLENLSLNQLNHSAYPLPHHHLQMHQKPQPHHFINANNIHHSVQPQPLYANYAGQTHQTTVEIHAEKPQDFKSNTSIDSIDAIPFANDNAGTIKQRVLNRSEMQSSMSSSSSSSSLATTVANISQSLHKTTNGAGTTTTPSPTLSSVSVSGSDGQKISNTIDSNVLNDIGNMLANLTDELDAMLEEEKRAGLNDSE